jgi:hypothetical protein
VALSCPVAARRAVLWCPSAAPPLLAQSLKKLWFQDFTVDKFVLLAGS